MVRTTNSTSSSARISGVDRFYTPPAVRRQLEQKQEKPQKHQDNQLKKPSKTKLRQAQAAKSPEIGELHMESDDSSPNSNGLNSRSSTPSVPVGNLDRFLESTTPVVPGRRKVRRCSGTKTSQSCVFYKLGDLWEFFKEWSAYGNGVPLLLNGEDEVVQYYVPYLSGIQLFIDTSRQSSRLRQHVEESDGVIHQDTCSESSSASNSNVDQEGPLNGEKEGPAQSSKPIFEYMAHDSPYGREPLSEKIKELASKFPGLNTYRSYDLLPSSWMCVAWYPIYRIPTGQTLKDLDACFLTFYLLSTPKSNPSNGYSICNGGSNVIPKALIRLSIPSFGLASYKLNSSIWTTNEPYELQQASSLLEAADDWLRRLNVDHPDFRFFFSRYSTPWR